MNHEALVLFFIISVVLVGGGILFSMIVSPKSTNEAKHEAYECGIPAKGKAWIQFNVGYYLFAIVYLIFDVEVAFIYPWGAVMRHMVDNQLGGVAFTEIVIFFFVLGLGLVYAWKKGALKWQ